MAGQSRPPALEVTVPLPVPALLTARVKVCRSNAAATDRVALTVTIQLVPETESHPRQPLKIEPPAGVARRLTTVPLA